METTMKEVGKRIQTWDSGIKIKANPKSKSVSAEAEFWEPPTTIWVEQQQQQQYQPRPAVQPFVPSPIQQRKQEQPSDIQCLTSTMQQMMQAMMTMQEEAKKSNDNIARIAASLEKGKLPAQAVQNPNQGGSSNTGDNTRNCNAVTTLRSGKQFQNPEPSMQYQSQEEEEPIQDEEESHDTGDFEILDEAEPEVAEREEEVPTLDDPPPRKGTVIAAPFPQRLTSPSKGKNFNEIGEILRKVTINIPLLDAINQIPSYAKYLKELCTVKRQLNVRKKSFSTEHVSTVVQA